MSDTIKIDPRKLTLNELEEIEEIVGKATSDIFGDGNGNAPSLTAKALKALVFVIGKRDNPDLTLEEAGAFDLTSLEIVGEDPTDAAKPSA